MTAAEMDELQCRKKAEMDTRPMYMVPKVETGGVSQANAPYGCQYWKAGNSKGNPDSPDYLIPTGYYFNPDIASKNNNFTQILSAWGNCPDGSQSSTCGGQRDAVKACNIVPPARPVGGPAPSGKVAVEVTLEIGGVSVPDAAKSPVHELRDAMLDGFDQLFCRGPLHLSAENMEAHNYKSYLLQLSGSTVLTAVFRAEFSASSSEHAKKIFDHCHYDDEEPCQDFTLSELTQKLTHALIPWYREEHKKDHPSLTTILTAFWDHPHSFKTSLDSSPPGEDPPNDDDALGYSLNDVEKSALVSALRSISSSGEITDYELITTDPTPEPVDEPETEEDEVPNDSLDDGDGSSGNVPVFSCAVVLGMVGFLSIII